MTALTIITRAMRLMNFLAAGETPDADDKNDAYESLLAMIDAWGAERLMMFRTVRTTYTWTANQSSRTIGPSGSLSGSTERPAWIDSAGVIPYGGTAEQEVDILNEEEYQAIPIKSTTAEFFTKLFYAPTVTNGTLTVFPVPTTAATLVLYTPVKVPTFANLTDTYTAPNGYEDLLVFSLARRMALEWGATWTTMHEQQYLEASERVKAKNTGREWLMRVDHELMPIRGSFNIYTGE